MEQEEIIKCNNSSNNTMINTTTATTNTSNMTEKVRSKSLDIKITKMNFDNICDKGNSANSISNIEKSSVKSTTHKLHRKYSNNLKAKSKTEIENLISAINKTPALSPSPSALFLPKEKEVLPALSVDNDSENENENLAGLNSSSSESGSSSTGDSQGQEDNEEEGFVKNKNSFPLSLEETEKEVLSFRQKYFSRPIRYSLSTVLQYGVEVLSSIFNLRVDDPFGMDDLGKEVLPESTLKGVAEYIKNGRARNIIVLSGAGISTTAGIPDFRSPKTGLYSNLKKYNLPYPEAIFTLDYFKVNPEPFYQMARQFYPGNYKPTIAHYFIKELQNRKLLLRNYTQNIDALERICGLSDNKIVEAHGSFNSAYCIGTVDKKGCKKTYDYKWLYKKLFPADGKFVIPRCENCNGLVKPAISFFGESIPDKVSEYAKEDFAKCDLLIVMGTSLKVEPLARLVHEVGDDVPRLLINRTMVSCFDKEKHPSMSRINAWDNIDIFNDPDYVDAQVNRDVVYLGDCDETCLKLAGYLGFKRKLINVYEKEMERLNLEIDVDPENVEGYDHDHDMVPEKPIPSVVAVEETDRITTNMMVDSPEAKTKIHHEVSVKKDINVIPPTSPQSTSKESHQRLLLHPEDNTRIKSSNSIKSPSLQTFSSTSSTTTTPTTPHTNKTLNPSSSSSSPIAITPTTIPVSTSSYHKSIDSAHKSKSEESTSPYPLLSNSLSIAAAKLNKLSVAASTASTSISAALSSSTPSNLSNKFLISNLSRSHTTNENSSSTSNANSTPTPIEPLLDYLEKEETSSLLGQTKEAEEAEGEGQTLLDILQQQQNSIEYEVEGEGEEGFSNPTTFNSFDNTHSTTSINNNNTINTKPNADVNFYITDESQLSNDMSECEEEDKEEKEASTYQNMNYDHAMEEIIEGSSNSSGSEETSKTLNFSLTSSRSVSDSGSETKMNISRSHSLDSINTSSTTTTACSSPSHLLSEMKQPYSTSTLLLPQSHHPSTHPSHSQVYQKIPNTLLLPNKKLRTNTKKKNVKRVIELNNKIVSMVQDEEEALTTRNGHEMNHSLLNETHSSQQQQQQQQQPKPYSLTAAQENINNEEMIQAVHENIDDVMEVDHLGQSENLYCDEILTRRLQTLF